MKHHIRDNDRTNSLDLYPQSRVCNRNRVDDLLQEDTSNIVDVHPICARISCTSNMNLIIADFTSENGATSTTASIKMLANTIKLMKSVLMFNLTRHCSTDAKFT